jgi:hypothetical protein
MLQEELQNALLQIDELRTRIRDLEAKVLPAGDGKKDTVHAKKKVAKYMVVGDSMLRNVGADHADMMVECFPGIKIEQLHRVTEKRNLGSPETAIINDLRTTRNLDFVIVEA